MRIEDIKKQWELEFGAKYEDEQRANIYTAVDILDFAERVVNKLLIHGVIPRSFYVVAKTYETGEDLAQLSTALDSYERAKTFRDSKFNKEKYPNAFIVSSLNEV